MTHFHVTDQKMGFGVVNDLFGFTQLVQDRARTQAGDVQLTIPHSTTWDHLSQTNAVWPSFPTTLHKEGLENQMSHNESGSVEEILEDLKNKTKNCLTFIFETWPEDPLRTKYWNVPLKVHPQDGVGTGNNFLFYFFLTTFPKPVFWMNQPSKKGV